MNESHECTGIGLDRKGASVETLARPSASLSLQITNCCSPHALPHVSNQIKSNQKRICIASYISKIQRRLADGLSDVGAMIQISF